MSRFPLAILAAGAMAVTAAGCGPTGGQVQTGRQAPRGGLTLTVSFGDPLRSGRPVTWTLEVANRGPEVTTLVFPSGKDGDVALFQGAREAYRWSDTRLFTQAMRRERLEPGERREFSLEETGLPVEPGQYELVASLASEPAPAEFRRAVSVSR